MVNVASTAHHVSFVLIEVSNHNCSTKLDMYSFVGIKIDLIKLTASSSRTG